MCWARWEVTSALTRATIATQRPGGDDAARRAIDGLQGQLPAIEGELNTAAGQIGPDLAEFVDRFRQEVVAQRSTPPRGSTKATLAALGARFDFDGYLQNDTYQTLSAAHQGCPKA